MTGIIQHERELPIRDNPDLESFEYVSFLKIPLTSL